MPDLIPTNKSTDKQFFSTYEDVESWLVELEIKNYEIDSKSLEVGVDGDLILTKVGLTYLPVQFSYIAGDFNISSNKLTSLKGCPRHVEKTFNCSDNVLTSLQHSPKYVGKSILSNNNRFINLEGLVVSEVRGDLIVSRNRLTSLKGSPRKILGLFKCDSNRLTTLEGGPEVIGSDYICSENKLEDLIGSPLRIEGSFDCSYNQIESLVGAPRLVEDNFFCQGNHIDNVRGLSERIGGGLAIDADIGLLEEEIRDISSIKGSVKFV